MRFQRSPPVCPVDGLCSQWARIYLKYCLCSVRDGVSLTLGLVSVASWGVAEVPQIITNYKEKSTEGLSLAFLMTWIVGDVFNLVGCLLEPATLPTQFYMALLYTATTVVLTAQTIFYGHIYPHLKENTIGQPCKGDKLHLGEKILERKHYEGFIEEKQFSAGDDTANGSNTNVEGVHMTSSPIPVAASALPHIGSYGRDLYYMSARSLSRSPKPIVGLFQVHSRDSGRTHPASVYDQHSIGEPLLVSAQSAPSVNTKNMLCLVASAVFFLGSIGLHLPIDSRPTDPPPGSVIIVGRKLLQYDGMSSLKSGGGSSGIGTILGWAMAAIYMGGRLPQIYLNIRRDNVDFWGAGSCAPNSRFQLGQASCFSKNPNIGTILECTSKSGNKRVHLEGGLLYTYSIDCQLQVSVSFQQGLNPLMFIFALVGNATYVASILVNSLEWPRVKPNLPWLVDAAGCVILDAFILIQFAYYRYWKAKDLKSRHKR